MNTSFRFGKNKLCIAFDAMATNNAGMSEIGDRLRDRARELNLADAEVARRADLSPRRYGHYVSGDRKPDYDTLMKICEVLKCTPNYLLGVAVAPTQLEDLPPQVHPETAAELPARATMPRDVPVMGTAVGGDNGDFRFNGEAVDYVRRPPGLDKIREAFAIYLRGDSMSPRFDHGDLLYIHPGQPVRPGDYVLVELHGQDSEPGACYVKRLVKQTAHKLVLAQFNPPIDNIEVPADRVKSALKILTPTELLGV